MILSSKFIQNNFLVFLIYFLLSNSVYVNAESKDSKNIKGDSISKRVDYLSDTGVLVSQKAEGIDDPMVSCGQVCLVNLLQIILDFTNRPVIKEPTELVNKLNLLRISDTENGSSHEELSQMWGLLTEKYLAHDVSIKTIHLLDLPVNNGDHSIPRSNEINSAQLDNLVSSNNFGMLGFSAFYKGKLATGHGILVLGKDPSTDHFIILDPMIGKTAFVTFHEEPVLEGQKTLSMRFERSESDSPYWKSYTNYGKLYLTGFIHFNSSTITRSDESDFMSCGQRLE